MSSSINETVLLELQEQYGGQLHGFTYEQKIVIRAALAGFIAQKPVWQPSNSGITCMQSCIESAGVDWNIWDKDPEVCEFIEACDQLEDSNIEGVIAALSEQIRYRH